MSFNRTLQGQPNPLAADLIQRLRQRVRETLSLSQSVIDKKIDVFISYRQSESRDIASQIFKMLRRTRHPKLGKTLNVFLDDERIKVGQNIHVTIQAAIRSSAAFIVLLSPTYSRTEYTSFEHMLITGEDWGGLQERIIPVLIQDCEIPERLRALKYLDFRSYASLKSKSPIQLDIPIIRTYCLRITQERFANCLAAHLRVGPIRKFGFIEECGDIIPDGSYLELRDGTKISFLWFDIRCAISHVCQEAVGPLLAEGFTVSDFVAKQFADRYGQEKFLPLNEPILILLEKLERDLQTASTEDIAHALELYAFELPSEFDRSHLNGLPRPSPSWDLIHELINRKAWDALRECILEVASMSEGVATLWTCEIVSRRAEIADSEMLKQLEASKPLRPEAIKTWAERLLEYWN